MTTAITLTTKISALDSFSKENSMALLMKDGGAFSQAIAVATAMNQLQDMIDEDVMKAFLPLQGKDLGFRTDKDTTGGYKEDVVKSVLITATMRGFQMVNNQINIIGGRCYVTLQGFEYFFKSKMGGIVTDLRLDPSVPKITGEGAVVHYKASWKLSGTADSIERDIPVKVNAGMGPDAILGKAKRKILAAIYERVTGTTVTEGDATETQPVVDIESRTEIVSTLDDTTVAKLNELFKVNAEKVNAFFISKGILREGQTYADLTPELAEKAIKNPTGLLKQAGVAAS